MHHIIYVSRATQYFNNEQLQTLLEQARLRNNGLQITGILLYGQNRFMQVLEGEKLVVKEVYARITADSRHRDTTTFADKPITARAFQGWAMAYHPIDPAHFQQLADFVAPEQLRLQQPGLMLADQHLLQLLRSCVLPEGS